MHNFDLIISFVAGVSFLIFLVLKSRIHIFPALIISSAVIGLLSGLSSSETVSAITTGFGNTLASIGIIIGLSCMLGKLLEVSGAAEKIADVFIRWVGTGKEHWALAITGGIVSISVFSDSGFVILIYLVKSIAKKSKKTFLTLSLALAAGLIATHHLVPPTPGPLGAAEILNVDMGLMIFYGLIISIPVLIATVFYASFVGGKIDIELKEDDNQPEDEKSSPGIINSMLPIVVPIILIIIRTMLRAFNISDTASEIFDFIGNPVFAVLIGVLIAVFSLTKNFGRAEILKFAEKSMAYAGIIILITGAGGSLGNVLRVSGIGTQIAELSVSLSIPAIILPFLVSTLVRFAQGSGTVAMITSASIIAPMMGQLQINPVSAALACCVGSIFFSYFNDSFFWVFTKFTGLDVKQGIKTWSVTTTIGWAVGFISLLILNMFL